MNPVSGVELVLVNEAAVAPYSGMIPGLVGGQYQKREVMLDLVSLCQRSGATFILDTATDLQPEARQVTLANRGTMGYTVTSINLGSKSRVPLQDHSHPRMLSVKPLHELLHSIETWEKESLLGAPASIAIVGSGAGGAELSLALRKRWAGREEIEIHLIDANSTLLPKYSLQTRKNFHQALQGAKIHIHTGKRVNRATENEIFIGEQSIKTSLVIWCTGAAPTPFLSQLTLAKDREGFLLTRETLQSQDYSNIFISGDCASLLSFPDLPKAGVYAVRQGPILIQNLRAYLNSETLKTFKPQKRFLTILNTSDGKAIANYGSFSLYHSLAWQWKDWIDRKWMHRFALAPMPHSDTPMRCGGCGSKVSGKVLEKSLPTFKASSSAVSVLNLGDREDASAHFPPEGKVELQSVDFFKTFSSDLYLCGWIAAKNAVSDIYAMNAVPAVAQCLITLPESSETIQNFHLNELLQGVRRGLSEENTVLLGGHTSEMANIGIGLWITGYGNPKQLFRKGGLRPGDKLLLTKPLGSGTLLAALALGELDSDAWLNLKHWLCHSNRKAAEILASYGISACTDVSGFGLGGHLREMLRASDTGAELLVPSIPLYDGAAKALSKKIHSSLAPDNKALIQDVFDSEIPSLFLDPQTSGGLLAGVPENLAGEIETRMREAGLPQASIIGSVTQKTSKALIQLRQ